MPPQDVVLVGHMDFFFNPVAEAAVAKGHRFVRYKTPADFLADKNALATASVAYAVGYCPVSRDAMSRAPNLRAVICPWTGTDGFDGRAATDLGTVPLHDDRELHRSTGSNSDLTAGSVRPAGGRSLTACGSGVTDSGLVPV